MDRSTALIGDRWTLLVIRDLAMGIRRFHDLQAQTGATPQMLAARLKQLEADGLAERRPYSARPARHEYHLTTKGLDLVPVLLALRAWGERWCKQPDEGLAMRTAHRACGTQLSLDGYCAKCEQLVGWLDMIVQPTPEYAREMQVRAEAFKVASGARSGRADSAPPNTSRQPRPRASSDRRRQR